MSRKWHWRCSGQPEMQQRQVCHLLFMHDAAKKGQRLRGLSAPCHSLWCTSLMHMVKYPRALLLSASLEEFEALSEVRWTVGVTALRQKAGLLTHRGPLPFVLFLWGSPASDPACTSVARSTGGINQRA